MVFILFPNTLFDIKYLDKSKDYVLYEHPRFFSRVHINKLILHRATMKYYYDYLKQNNFKIKYVCAKPKNINLTKIEKRVKQIDNDELRSSLSNFIKAFDERNK